MGSHSIELQIYADVGLEVEGLRKQVSIDPMDSCDEAVVPYSDLVDQEIDYNIKPDGTMNEETYFKMEAIANALCEAGFYMKKKLSPIKISE